MKLSVIRRKYGIVSFMVLSMGLGSVACTEVYDEGQTSSAKLAPPSGQGWVDVTPGVWQRELADGTLETYTAGNDGLRWMMPHLEEAGATLLQAYQQEPTQERWEQLVGHEQMMDEARRALAGPAKVPDNDEGIMKAGCDVSFGHNANAYALSPGVKATATANYWTNCSGFTGGVYTYAYAKIDTLQQANACGWRYGANVSCSSTSYLNGSGSDCYSYALARVRDQVGYYYTSTRENFSCGSTGTLTWLSREDCYDLFGRPCTSEEPYPQCPSDPAGKSCTSGCWYTISSRWADRYECF